MKTFALIAARLAVVTAILLALLSPEAGLLAQGPFTTICLMAIGLGLCLHVRKRLATAPAPVKDQARRHDR